MKKRMLALLLTASMLAVLSGCAESSESKKEEGSVVPSKVSIASGNSSGTVYYIAAGMSNVLNDKISDIEFSTEATGGGANENCTIVHEYPDMLGLAALDGVQAAYEGDEGRGFTEAYDDLRVIAVGHKTTIYIAATEASGIKSVADFEGKKIGWPAVGSSADFVMQALVDAYGIDLDKLNRDSISLSDQVDAMKDGQIDVFSGAGAIPMAGCSELALNCDVNFISLDDDDINEKILEINPTWEIETMEPGIYEGQDYEVKLVRIPMTLVCNKALDEDTVYEITKNICENSEEIEAVHSEGKWWNAENVLPYYEEQIVPFHPGAEKYYEEISQ